jgi:3-dehydroquinate synthase
MLAAMGHDKKVQGGRPRFVLLRGIGQAFAGAEVEPAELMALLSAPQP